MAQCDVPCSFVAFVTSLGTNMIVALFRTSLAFSYPCVKSSRMSIHSYFTVKHCDEPELERLFLLAWQRVWEAESTTGM